MTPDQQPMLEVEGVYFNVEPAGGGPDTAAGDRSPFIVRAGMADSAVGGDGAGALVDELGQLLWVPWVRGSAIEHHHDARPA